MIKVGVIRGGISDEYEVSLATGANILLHLRTDPMNAMKYKIYDILIDKEGVWHLNGLPISLEKLSRTVDVIVNALHGEFGEDGKVQQMLEQWNIPYTGSGILASAVGYNKVLAKEEFKKLGIKTPSHFVIPPYQPDFDGERNSYAQRKAVEVFRKLSPPWIVKPLSGGSSLGIHVCKTLPELIKVFENPEILNVSTIAEELITGREATVGVIEDFRGQDLYALPAIEIRPPKEKTFFDYDSKYSGKAEEICPGNFSNNEREELHRLAKLIHSGLNLSHSSRSDFIITPNRGIYVLEVNTLPGMTDESLVPKSLAAVGVNMPEFIDHLIGLALAKK